MRMTSSVRVALAAVFAIGLSTSIAAAQTWASDRAQRPREDFIRQFLVLESFIQPS